MHFFRVLQQRDGRRWRGSMLKFQLGNVTLFAFSVASAITTRILARAPGLHPGTVRRSFAGANEGDDGVSEENVYGASRSARTNAVNSGVRVSPGHLVSRSHHIVSDIFILRGYSSDLAIIARSKFLNFFFYL